MAAPIDFVAIAARLLDRAEEMARAWLPNGYKQGRYWYVGDFDGAKGKSANVDLKSGKWGDNGHKGDAGLDLLSLYRRVFRHATMADAARELMGEPLWRAPPIVQPPAKPGKAEVEWRPIRPTPHDAPHYTTQWAHYARGIPKLHWEYRDAEGLLLGIVVRFDRSNGTKDVQPISYCQGSNGVRMWRYKAFGQPRPLYGLPYLAQHPPAAEGEAAGLVIVVEGEKKCDALWHALGESVPVVSWPGGCKVPHLADWGPLAGRRVVCWPDADAQRNEKTGELLARDDQPGMLAMIKVQHLLTGRGCTVRIVDIGAPGERPGGWDAADAVAEGMDRDALLAFMRNLLPAAQLHLPPLAGGGSGGASTPPAAARGSDGERSWRAALIWRKGEPRECVPNVMMVLRKHAQWQGVIAFDEFSQRVVKRLPAPFDSADMELPSEWTDVDDTRAAAWIARSEGFVPNSGMVAEAANEVAHSNPFHPVLDWLGGLVWDGTPRLEHWMIDLLGAQDSAYIRLVSRYFLIGMCMRVLEPGCKFDCCLVLEGPQGRKKSTALRILGGEWFSDIELDLQNKDSMSNIRGKWLHEFGEMGSLARSESNRQKSFLSRQIDEFRPVYGRREIRCKRQSAFAGSTNEWAWNKDPTGGRRFWPFEVGEIETAGLAAIRDQLFAEAFAAAKAGVRYWPDVEEQRALFDPEQLARESPDAFADMLGSWLAGDMWQYNEFSLADACMSGLKLDAKAMTKDVQTRVGTALHKLGCERVEKRNSIPRFVYKRPRRIAASSTTGDELAQQEGDRLPF